MSDSVRVTQSDGVLHLTLARPEKKNALNNAMYATLTAAIERAETDPEIRAVLLDAEGNSFSAGNDISDFAAVAMGSVPASAMESLRFLDRIARAQKPFVAAVQGHAVGIGLTMLMHFDVVYVAADARLSAPFVNLGVVPEAASSVLIPQRIGHARAYALFALGESIDGHTAAEWGLVTAALPAAQVQERALQTAQALAAKSPAALRATKQLMRDADAIATVIEREGVEFGNRLRSPEAMEAFMAFAQQSREHKG